MDEIIEDLQWLRMLNPKSTVQLSHQAAEALELPIHTTVEDVFKVIDKTETLIEIESDLNMEL